MSLPVIRDEHGHERKLGFVHAPPWMLRAGAVRIGDHREKNGLPRTIPRSEWMPRDFVTGLTKSLIEDQRNYGSCTAATATGAGARMRWLRGQKFEPLSWAWLYDQVNGGRDAGSNIAAANEVVRRLGVPPMASYPDCQFRAEQYPAGVKWYRESLEVIVDGFEECAVALQMGMLPQFPIDAGGRFERFDGNGVSTGAGGSPNHSVYAAGIDRIGGQWCLRLVNSWRDTWGPFADGTCWVTEEAVNNCAGNMDGAAHAVTIEPEER